MDGCTQTHIATSLFNQYMYHRKKMILRFWRWCDDDFTFFFIVWPLFFLFICCCLYAAFNVRYYLFELVTNFEHEKKKRGFYTLYLSMCCFPFSCFFSRLVRPSYIDSLLNTGKYEMRKNVIEEKKSLRTARVCTLGMWSQFKWPKMSIDESFTPFFFFFLNHTIY